MNYFAIKLLLSDDATFIINLLSKYIKFTNYFRKIDQYQHFCVSISSLLESLINKPQYQIFFILLRKIINFINKQLDYLSELIKRLAYHKFFKKQKNQTFLFSIFLYYIIVIV